MENTEIKQASIKVVDKLDVVELFRIEYDDVEYNDNTECKFYKFLKDLYELEGGKEIFDKYDAILNIPKK